MPTPEGQDWPDSVPSSREELSTAFEEVIMKICSYVIKVDLGLAPNPYWGYCSLAVCTPNHQKARLVSGDWIVGNSPAANGQKLVYAMRVDEVLDFDSYFRDPRFKRKQPNPRGSMEEQVGDNFYYREDNRWRRLPSMFHNDESFFFKDLGADLSGRPVFVGKHFYYFGDKRINFPESFREIIRDSQGIRYLEGILVVEFIRWLGQKYKPGMIGRPLDQPNAPRFVGNMITCLSRQNSMSSFKSAATHFGTRRGCE